MVQEFDANVSSKFSNSGGEKYVHGVLVPFDSSVINSVLGLEPSYASDMYNFNLLTCHYDMKSSHCEAYLTPLFLWLRNKCQISS